MIKKKEALMTMLNCFKKFSWWFFCKSWSAARKMKSQRKSNDQKIRSWKLVSFVWTSWWKMTSSDVANFEGECSCRTLNRFWMLDWVFKKQKMKFWKISNEKLNDAGWARKNCFYFADLSILNFENINLCNIDHFWKYFKTELIISIIWR